MGTEGCGTKYTEPRQLTLNTKYDGVPKIEVWPGYAVLVVGSEGSRRVVEGPQVILLECLELVCSQRNSGSLALTRGGAGV